MLLKFKPHLLLSFRFCRLAGMTPVDKKTGDSKLLLHLFEKQLLLVFLCSLGSWCSAQSQVNAGFTADITGGCSPLTVRFTNTSTASSSAVYQWDFGNGNTSTLKDPGAVFLDQKNYTVTLTVTDGSQTSTTSKTITVYQKPVIDFSSSSSKVCTPQAATFTAKATADNGDITGYTWDFGDGFTQQTNDPQVSHAYLTAQDAQVRLSVTDNHGCSNSKTISNILKVFSGVTAAFDAQKTFICFQGDPVQMENKSVGDGPLKYSWDFGDGIGSTEKAPVHVFSKKGTYTVSLAVESQDGCKDSIVKTSWLNVGNFTSQLSVPDLICKNSPVEIKNTSTPAPASFSLLIDGKQTVSPDYYGNYYYTFPVAGEHTIQLTNHFGDCVETITKKVEVKELLKPKGFIAEISQQCTEPMQVTFTDTTVGAVKSEWNFDPFYVPLPVNATGKKVSYNFYTGTRNITLFVTDSNGCQTSITQPLTLQVPYTYIQRADNSPDVACDSLPKKFKAISNQDILSYNWEFGNGDRSTLAEPSYTFHNIINSVTLTYTTTTGCTTNAYYSDIYVYPGVKADFESTSGTEICGNSIVTFKSTLDYNFQNSAWLVDGQNAGNGYYNTFDYQFQDTGKHTITEIVYNTGCRDTLTRVDYIHVMPSFPKITDVITTCEGDRATIIFKHASRYAESGMWDFGDGTSAPFNKDQVSVSHHYAATGDYKAVLTTSNGQCTNQDSIFSVPVVLKSDMLLSSKDTAICQENGLSYSLSNFSQQRFIFGPSYYVHSYQYKDGTEFLLGSGSYDFENWITGPVYNNIFKNVAKGEDSIRIVTNMEMFTPTTPFHEICLDTTNFIPIKVTGSVARFEVVNKEGCFQRPFYFNDSSISTNTNIISREWNFGDGQTLVTTKAGIVSHTYSEPGTYSVTLTTIDAGGCSSTDFVGHMVTANGPKANFTIISLTFHLNTPVQFYNSTNEFGGGNIKYEWNFGDGSTSTEFNPLHVFSKAGNFKIRLIAKSLTTGCADTIYQQITVKNFNANFSFTSSFLNTNDCSSVLVQFVNTSVDYTHLKWDFGDGFTSDNINNPSHVYNQPGRYLVKLFVTGNNGLSKTYTDSIFIKDNKVTISASMNRTCTAQSVTLAALSGDASSYLWDFGDGTIVQASDTFSVHYYKTPGNYIPKLISKDGNGCVSSAVLNNKISIDSLNVSLKNSSKICAPKEVQFNPVITNIASEGGQSLTYHWDFGTGNKKDTANTQAPAFTFRQPGNYEVTLQVQSSDGCIKATAITIIAAQGLGGKINGPTDICQQSVAQFSGSTLLPGTPSWKWIFDDGTVVNQQNPPVKKYDNAGDYPVKLIVDNNGCIDTVNHVLRVHSKPQVILSVKDQTICEGSSIQLSVDGGDSYTWSPAASLNITNGASVTASPVINTKYTVAATNVYGCSNTDSISINVIHPFTLTLQKEVSVCSGSSTSLEASGGITYHWINNTMGLDNITVSSPVASPLTSTTYTVVATGEKQCFSDTASVKVVVNPAPFVKLGKDTTLCQGQSITLNAFNPNAVYSWQDGSNSPALVVKNGGEYHVKVDLNQCTASDTIIINQMAIPYFTLGKDTSICEGEQYILKPSVTINGSFLWQDGSNRSSFSASKEGIYSLTASNECGTYTDSIVISSAFCNILMPTGFTPNNDGLNDVFRVKYPFAVRSFHMVVYNAWGEKVFETNKINEGWDGSFKGEPAIQGTYVWMISFTDNNNKGQQMKGVVNLLR